MSRQLLNTFVCSKVILSTAKYQQPGVECHYCRVASVSERNEANDLVLFEILLGIYIYIWLHLMQAGAIVA